MPVAKASAATSTSAPSKQPSKPFRKKACARREKAGSCFRYRLTGGMGVEQGGQILGAGGHPLLGAAGDQLSGGQVVTLGAAQPAEELVVP